MSSEALETGAHAGLSVAQAPPRTLDVALVTRLPHHVLVCERMVIVSGKISEDENRLDSDRLAQDATDPQYLILTTYSVDSPDSCPGSLLHFRLAFRDRLHWGNALNTARESITTERVHEILVEYCPFSQQSDRKSQWEHNG